MKNAKGRQAAMAQEVSAYHEAGHAVAAIRTGIGIGRSGVSIAPGEHFSGMDHLLKRFSGNPDKIATGTMRLGAEKHAIASLAGELAQRKFRPSSVRSYHGQTDRHNAVKLMSYFVSSDRELSAYLKWLKIRAEQLVGNDATWTMIEAVAKALIKRDRLSAKEAKEIALGAYWSCATSAHK